MIEAELESTDAFVKMKHSKDFSYPFTYVENGTPYSDTVAEHVSVKFSNYKTGTFDYDPATGLYMIGQYDDIYIDGNTGKPVTFKNFIAIYCNQYYADSAGHKFYDSIGTGEGYAAINGTIVPITWKRDGLRNQYTYALKDGTPLSLDVGKTFIALVGIKNPIAYE